MKSPRIFVLCSLIAIGSYGLAGCMDEKKVVTPPIEKDTLGKHVDDHAHGHHGPHDGHIIEVGSEKYHAELVHDDDAHKVTIYILDGEVKNPVPIDAKEITINLVADGEAMQFALPAVPLDGEPEGKSSRFELASEKLMHEMEEEGSKPRLRFMIGETQLGGDIVIDEHDDHDHEHGEDDHDDDHDDRPRRR